MWAAEIKKVDVEGLPKWEEKELFKCGHSHVHLIFLLHSLLQREVAEPCERHSSRTYMEDYNTATLPHKKFYDLDLYERRRLVKAAKKGKTLVCATAPPHGLLSARMLQSHPHLFASIVVCNLEQLPSYARFAQEEEKADFNDEAEVAAARKRQEMAAQQERLREAYNELKYTAPDKVEAMRDQEMTRLQMNLAYRTGELLSCPHHDRNKPQCRQ